MGDENRSVYCFTWKIENYSLCFRNTGKNLKSPVFYVDNFLGSKWYLIFYPSFKKCGKEFISCYLYRNKEDMYDEEIKISFSIEVIDGNGKTIHIIGDSTTLYNFSKGEGLGWNDFVSPENVTRAWDNDILTICCRMFAPLKQPESEVYSEIGIDKCSFQWKVNFPACITATQTKKFSFSESSQYEISMTAPNDRIDIEVIREGGSITRILRGEIFLINQNEEKILLQCGRHLFDLAEGSNTWHLTSAITKKHLEYYKNDYLKDGTFTLLCVFSTANGKESSGILRSASFTSKWNNIMILHEDISNLFTNMEHFDAELRSGSTILPAHRSLLAARSPVFSAMFYQDMIEKQSGVVDISDVDPETLKSFLEFIYTGAVDVRDYESASMLLMAADKYQVLSLKTTCSVFLMSALSLENACEILDLADMLNLGKLKKCALDYFVKHVKEIMNLSQWSKFSEKNAKLSFEILSYLANNFEILPKNNKK